MTLLSEVREIATGTRAAIKSLSQDRHRAVRRIERILGTSFPTKWCDFASCALALQLARKLDLGDINLCKWTSDTTGQLHYWLRTQDIDVDITADQFDYIVDPVIVAVQSPVHTQYFPTPNVSPVIARKPTGLYFDRAVVTLAQAIWDHLTPSAAETFAQFLGNDHA